MPPHVLIAAIVVSALLMLTSCASTGPARADGPTKFRLNAHKNIAYREGQGLFDRSHQLDVYQPEGVENAPVLLWVHGGAWQIGSKFWDAHIAKRFAKRGILSVAINYRLGARVKHPDHIRDVARAFDWVKKHAAKYGGDPDNIFIGGHSAGGHLVALLATNEKYLREVHHSTNEIAGVIPVSGLYRVGATSVIFRGFDSEEDAFVDASPEFHVDEFQPPFLIVLGDHDLPLLDAQAFGFKRELDRHDSPVALVKARRRGHVTIWWHLGRDDDAATCAMLEFIATYSRNLDDPRTYLGL